MTDPKNYQNLHRNWLKVREQEIDQFSKSASEGQFDPEEFCQALKAGKVLEREFKNALDELLWEWERRAHWGGVSSRLLDDFCSAAASHSWSYPWVFRAEEIARKLGHRRRRFMTDEEYQKVLETLARQYVDLKELKALQITSERFNQAFERLSKAARETRSPEFSLERIKKEMPKLLEEIKIVHDAAVVTGVFDALEVGDGVALRNIRMSAIPKEDEDFLARCGLDDPKAWLTTIVAVANYAGVAGQRLEEAWDTVLQQLSRRLQEGFPADTPRKQRNLGWGILKILSGPALIAGNFFLATVFFGASVPTLVAKGGLPGLVACAGLGLTFFWSAVDDLRRSN